jgi:hypothetical protein
MSPQAFAVSVVILSACLLLAVVMLAMLSTDQDQITIQGPRESSTGEMSEPSTGGSCDDTTPHKRVALPTSESARTFQC